MGYNILLYEVGKVRGRGTGLVQTEFAVFTPTATNQAKWVQTGGPSFV